MSNDSEVGPSCVDETNEDTNSPECQIPTDHNGVPLSKTKLKKLRRYELMLAKRKECRQADREKKKRKLAQAKLEGIATGPTRKQLKQCTMASSNCKIRVAVDMDFDHLMQEKDVRRAVHQLTFCYAANRRAKNPLQYYIVNLKNYSRQIFESTPNRLNWDVHRSEKDLTELFEKQNIVYLTSDSPNVLDSLDESKVYIIGGLVDHNSEKGLCHRLAEEKGISHVRLPIDEYIEMKTRKVLTINHVFEILLKFTECKNWKEAFLTVIPGRKAVEEKIDDNSVIGTDSVEKN